MAEMDDSYLQEDPAANHHDLLVANLSWPSRKQSNDIRRKHWKKATATTNEENASYLSFLNIYHHPHQPLQIKKVNLNKIVQIEKACHPGTRGNS